MSETLQRTLPPVIYEKPQPDTHRDEVLRQLLPYDYDYAQQEGLIDLFYYNPLTGADGLIHTLAGDKKAVPMPETEKQGEANNGLVEGFHHEPSGEIVWPTIVDENGAYPSTRVDRSALGAMTGKKRKKFKEYPFEPYTAPRVVIKGLVKYSLQPDAANPEDRKVPVRNSMYPNEYDTLAVMQAIKQAYLSRDPAEDIDIGVSESGMKMLLAEGHAVLIDGKTPMRIRMILEADSKRVLTAIPIVGSTPGLMKLEAKDADSHIYGNLLK